MEAKQTSKELEILARAHFITWSDHWRVVQPLVQRILKNELSPEMAFDYGQKTTTDFYNKPCWNCAKALEALAKLPKEKAKEIIKLINIANGKY